MLGGHTGLASETAGSPYPKTPTSAELFPGTWAEKARSLRDSWPQLASLVGERASGAIGSACTNRQTASTAEVTMQSPYISAQKGPSHDCARDGRRINLTQSPAPSEERWRGEVMPSD
jgi:hypothetical protein